MARHGEVGGLGVGVDDLADRVGAIVRGCPCGRDVSGVDAHAEGGAEAARVPLHHRRNAELVETLGLDGQADEARAVVGHETDVVWGDELGGDDEVALVLAVLIVDHDHELALLDVGNGLGDGGKGHLA